MSKEGSQYICLSLILFDSVFRTGKNCYPKVFLEEYKYVVKYVVKEKKTSKYIIEDIEISPDESDKEDSEKNLKKKTALSKCSLMSCQLLVLKGAYLKNYS